MPIRFLCTSCGQRLSIGSRKAGARIECPTCGEEQTVPEASTVRTPDNSPQQASDDVPSLADVAVYDEIPAPPGPEPSPPAKGKTPVDAPKATRSQEESAPAASLSDEMILLPRRTLYVQAGLFLALGLLALAAGYFIGRGDATLETVTAREEAARQPVRVSGTITWRDMRDTSQGDRGAVVIFLPEGARPDALILMDGLRPTDLPLAEDSPALRPIRDLGGVYTRTGPDGTYSVELPDRGRYNILFLSKWTRRPADVLPEQVDREELAAYFDDPTALIGRQKYHWAFRDFEADDRVDYDFGEDRGA
ncbi:MAG: hypothetical protein JW818_08810 [Pirellulales bacterium]|nr:hypothetical protein [Pirellulales bacterium]